jgi:hypothetical protein
MNTTSTTYGIDFTYRTPNVEMEYAADGYLPLRVTITNRRKTFVATLPNGEDVIVDVLHARNVYHRESGRFWFYSPQTVEMENVFDFDGPYDADEAIECAINGVHPSVRWVFEAVRHSGTEGTTSGDWEDEGAVWR